MSNKTFLTIFLLILPSLAFSKIRIMPLGNSITMGRHGEPGGYRDDLSHMLLDEGIDFTMVGSKNDGSGFYPYHEGHSGWRADEILASLNGWLNQNPPDIVLLHIGTNDISQGESNESTIIDIENILDTIHRKDRSTIILLCSLIPRFDEKENRPQRTDELNSMIFSLYLDKYALGWDIYFVDQNAAFLANPNWKTEWMDEYVHPNDAGYHAMAQTFFDVLYPILTNQKFYIAGNVRYYANSSPMNRVAISLSGDSSDLQLTDQNGRYQFDNLHANGNFAVSPNLGKITRFENTTITMYNAALTLRHAVGIDTLANGQQIAADVDKSGSVTAYDAALIARYVVELEMLSNDHVGEWQFQPDMRSYNNLNENENGANFTGILLGDVAGDWASPPLAKANPVDYLLEYKILQQSDTEISLMITAHADSVLSFLADVKYDNHDFELLNLRSSSDCALLINKTNGSVKFGFYSAHYIDSENLRFIVDLKKKNSFANDGAKLAMSFQINDFQLESQIAELNADREAMPSIVSIKPNYPNPFNPSTIIPFEIRNQGMLTVKIYNLLGQEIKTLYNNWISSGYHTLQWDGMDSEGVGVASGIYVCRFQIDDSSKEIRIIKSK